MEEEKRIVIRMTADLWRAFDDERHGERTTFQELGLRLFKNWLENARTPGTVTANFADKHDNIRQSAQYSANSEERWTGALTRILRSGNEVAVTAIRNNLIAFEDYVLNVPERAGDITDLAAKAMRLASIDREVDEIKAAPVAGGDVASVDSEAAPSGSGGRRTGTRGAGKKVG